MSITLIVIIMMSSSPKRNRKMIELSVVLMAYVA